MKWIEARHVADTGKTKVYQIFTREHGDVLGTVIVTL